MLINLILEILNVKKEIILSSNLNLTGEKTSKLVNICNYFAIKKYLINPGAMEYLEKDLDLISTNKIELYMLKQKNVRYKQYYEGFLSHLSIIDLLFNEGKNSSEVLLNSFEIQKIY